MAQSATTQKPNAKTNATASAATSAFVVLGGVSAAVLLYKAYKSVKSLSAPHPSVPTAAHMHPLFGHVPFLTKDVSRIHDANFELIKDHEIVAVKFPDHYRIFLNSPKLCEWVFTTAFDKFHKVCHRMSNPAFPKIHIFCCTKGTSQMPKFKALFGAYGQGIFVADGKQWRFHRKIGSRMFSVRNLRDYMFDCCRRTTQRTMDTLETLRSGGHTIDINDLLGRMTFDCFTSIAVCCLI